MPVLAGVIVLSRRRRHRRQHSSVLVDPGRGPPAAAGRGGRQSAFHLVEPRSDGGSHPGSSWLEYEELAHRLTSLQEPIAFRMVPLSVGDSGRTERTYALLVSGNYFESLGLTPQQGRFIRATRSRSPAAHPS